MKERIGIITYHFPHLKTEQVLTLLCQRHVPVHRIYALPFTARPARETLIEHRPDQKQAAAPEAIARRRGIMYTPCATDTDIKDDCDIYLVCGAGILSPECVRARKIINCHPGLIPAVRGLDSFKWAIFHKLPLGCTLHALTEEVDGGTVLSNRQTLVYSSDSLETLARRHYENEVLMLGFFDVFLHRPRFDFTDLPLRPPTRRMPLPIERQMCASFPEYTARYGEPAQAWGKNETE